MFLLSQPPEGSPDEGSLGQVKGALAFFFDPALGLGLALGARHGPQVYYL